jgi:hypothetical protein
MSCTEGINEIVLEELAPFTVELLVHWQLFRGEAEYGMESVCFSVKLLPPESIMTILIFSLPAPQGLDICS